MNDQTWKKGISAQSTCKYSIIHPSLSAALFKFRKLIISLFQPTSRSLPQDRSEGTNYEYGFREPKIVPPGRCTLRQALEFIGLHHSNPNKYTADYIAKEYTLDAERVKHILKHFHMYELQLPHDPQGRSYIERAAEEKQKSFSNVPNLLKLATGKKTNQ